MPLVQKKLSSNMKAFIKKVNKMKQEDADKAIDNYCDNFEKEIYQAIRDITITIPPGMIQVAGTPSAQANPAPIVLNKVVS